MTTIDRTAARSDAGESASRTPLLAALGIGSALVLTAVATFWDVTGNDSAGNDQDGTYPFVVGIVLVAALLTYGLVVRTARRGSSARRGLALGVVGLLSVSVFWSGIPLVLSSAAVACVLVDKEQHGRLAGLSKAALVLAAATAVLAGGLCIAG